VRQLQDNKSDPVCEKKDSEVYVYILRERAHFCDPDNNLIFVFTFFFSAKPTAAAQKQTPGSDTL
jgi:hypothetical protein